MRDMSNSTVAIVGASSGIGKALAKTLSEEGCNVVLSSRSEDKLQDIANQMEKARVQPVDMTVNESIEAWARDLPEIDHLVISASSAAHGPFADLEEAALRSMFEAKFFGPYRIAKAALGKIRKGGSITFFSGVLSRRPGMNCSGLGAVNGAVESLCYGLALELGPRLRVNCVSPGMIRSEAYAGMADAARETMYAATGESLPVGRVGSVDEAAEAALYLMSNSYSTGVVLDVDGGHMIRQYATRLECRVLIRQSHPFDGDPVHQASKAMIVVDRLVPGGAVVPHGDVPFLPPHAALEFGFLAMVVEHFKDRRRLVLSQPFDMGCEDRIDEKTPSAAQRMGHNHRMPGVLGGGFGIAEPPALGRLAVLRRHPKRMT